MEKPQRSKVEFGDFQTPPALAMQVTRYLCDFGEAPRAVVEPTCGLGSFVWAAARSFPTLERVIGFDVNGDHVRAAKSRIAGEAVDRSFDLQERDFFAIQWREILRTLPSPILILGNPPWVTASELGELGSKNLPVKSNFQNRNGLEAVTGSANFDIAEYMLIRLAEALSAVDGSLAMLVKTSVARRFLRHAWSADLKLSLARLLTFDSSEHFGVSAPACLLHCRFSNRPRTESCEVSTLDQPSYRQATLGWDGHTMCAEIQGFAATHHVARKGAPSKALRWRSGIKHDCASVMELTSIGSRFLNGRNEEVRAEEACLYPLIKGSALAAGRVLTTDRWLIVPQRRVGENTEFLSTSAPETWRYLLANSERLNRRSSSIYRNQPRFAIFGIGDYTFRPFKVAVSALYKKLEFHFVAPIAGKPVVFDDTVYFLSFDSESPARMIKKMLESETARIFYHSRIFWDSKRPLTTEILGRLDLGAMADHLGLSAQFQSSDCDPAYMDASAPLLF